MIMRIASLCCLEIIWLYKFNIQNPLKLKSSKTIKLKCYSF